MDLERSGVPPERRFTFFDQVHTTGMDIPQTASANAVLTLGKDLTFRDYAQAAYRMRGIGKGQCIILFVTPQVGRLRGRARPPLPHPYPTPHVHARVDG